MKRFIKDLFSRGPLSAADVVEDLAKKGITRDQILGDHLVHVYSRLDRLTSAPDFTSISTALPDRPNAPLRNNSALLGVIIETRRHSALEHVISNFYRKLHIPIQIFHGVRNAEYIRSLSISQLIDAGDVHLTQLETDALNARQYNALLLSTRFWKRLRSTEKILIFQTDTILCRHSDYHIEDFMSFDYIGSKWSRRRPVGLLIDGGNGGLSLRDWKKSYECLRRFSPQHWTGGEDGYFAFHMDIIGGKVGREDECARFSTQFEFLHKSFGAHRISYLDQKSKAAFLKYCPEARFMA